MHCPTPDMPDAPMIGIFEALIISDDKSSQKKTLIPSYPHFILGVTNSYKIILSMKIDFFCLDFKMGLALSNPRSRLYFRLYSRLDFHCLFPFKGVFIKFDPPETLLLTNAEILSINYQLEAIYTTDSYDWSPLQSDKFFVLSQDFK